MICTKSIRIGLKKYKLGVLDMKEEEEDKKVDEAKNKV